MEHRLVGFILSAFLWSRSSSSLPPILTPRRSAPHFDNFLVAPRRHRLDSDPPANVVVSYIKLDFSFFFEILDHSHTRWARVVRPWPWSWRPVPTGPATTTISKSQFYLQPQSRIYYSRTNPHTGLWSKHRMYASALATWVDSRLHYSLTLVRYFLCTDCWSYYGPPTLKPPSLTKPGQLTAASLFPASP